MQIATVMAALSLVSELGRAQNLDSVATVAKAITVRVEGPTQGSGALVRRQGELYTVMTAWHVVKDWRLGEEFDVFTNDGERHRVIESSVERVDQTDTAFLSFHSSRDYTIPARAKRVREREIVYVSGFPLGDESRSIRLVPLGVVGLADCVTQVSKGSLLYFLPKPEQSSRKGIDSHYKGSHKFLVYPVLDTVSGMSGGPVLTSLGLIVGHHNGGLGGVSDWGVAIKFGLNRGSLLPVDAPLIDSYIDKKSVCSVFHAYESWLQGSHQDAAKYSLSAYRIDEKSAPLISGPLLMSLSKLGRIDLLCEIHAEGGRFSNESLDVICKGGFPGLYQPK